MQTNWIDSFPQHDTSGSEPCTALDAQVEDCLRQLLYTIFDLLPNELLCLQAIMNHKTMTDWGKDMEKIAKGNLSFSRFRAFQTRKAILKKLGDKFAPALLTAGQRKQLKSK